MTIDAQAYQEYLSEGIREVSGDLASGAIKHWDDGYESLTLYVEGLHLNKGYHLCLDILTHTKNRNVYFTSTGRYYTPIGESDAVLEAESAECAVETLAFFAMVQDLHDLWGETANACRCGEYEGLNHLERCPQHPDYTPPPTRGENNARLN